MCDPVRFGGIPKPRHHMFGKRILWRRRDQDQVTPAFGDQSLDRHACKARIVIIQPAMMPDIRAVVGDEWKTSVQQKPNPRVFWFGTRKDQPVGQAILGNVPYRRHRVFAKLILRQVEVVPCVPNELGQTLYH